MSAEHQAFADRLEAFMLARFGVDVYEVDLRTLTARNFRRVIRDKQARELIAAARRS
jgi:hypothetical protein